MRSVSQYFAMLASVALVIVLATPAEALFIRPHFTAGPFPGLSRAFDGPDTDGLADPCAALDLSAPVTNEKAAFCLAIQAWQRHLRDPVVLDIEVYALEAPTLPFLGAASAPRWWLLAPEDSPIHPDLGYAAMRFLLRLDNFLEADSDALVRHLPTLHQLRLQRPDDIPADFKPTSVALTAPQLKAVGMRPRLGALFGGTPIEFATLENVDSVVVINTGRRPFDLEPRDGTGIGPLPRAIWDAYDLADPATVPDGFFPEVFDFVGLAAHEIGHILGFSSAVDRMNGEDFASLPREEQVINAMDLFRIEELGIEAITHPAAARHAVRNLRSDGIGPEAPELGNHVFLHAVRPGHGPSFVPLSSGLLGDGAQASHLRTSFVRVRDEAADLVSLRWIEDFDRPCPEDSPHAGLRCPVGTLMKPISVPHTPAVITAADLVVLDLTGWDVDRQGSLDPSGHGVLSGLHGAGKDASGRSVAPSTVLDDWAASLGLEANGAVVTVFD